MTPAVPRSLPAHAPAGLPAAWRAGRLIAAGVLGAGLLLSAPITAGLAGEAAWLAWLVHLVTGGLFCFGIGLLARQSGTSGGLPELAGVTWGTAGSRSLTALYLAGFVAGQAAIALTAGQLATYAIGGGTRAADGTDGTGGTGTATTAAIAIVAAAAVVAVAVRQVSERIRRWRLGVALVLGLAVCADSGLLRGADLLPVAGPGMFWPAVFLLLFAGVGWEQSARLASALRNPHELAASVAIALALTAAGYLLLAVVVGKATIGDWEPLPAAVSALVAICAVFLLASFCVTNLLAAAGFLGTFLPGGLPSRVAAVGGGVAVILAGALLLGWRNYHVLAGPAAATWLIYTLALCSGLRAAAPLLRTALIVPLAMLGLTLVAAGLALPG